ncbi:MAG: hypothetical protein H6632_00835 [Anaerolineales bacterium]|nr:hypothetical protein [Anaerolineales bacterium]
MNELRYTLLSDGSSDQALIPILTWTLRSQGVQVAIQSQWADLSRLPSSRRSLSHKIALSLDLYPCDLLFVHRDAEREPHQVRLSEIRQAVENLPDTLPPIVCVIPVRMQEAWLLFDEGALRVAAGNEHGRQLLTLPPLAHAEQMADPKSALYDLLREASGLSGRRRRKFRVEVAARRVAEFIDDFSPLRRLSAFNAFESEVRDVIEAQKWHLNSPPV